MCYPYTVLFQQKNLTTFFSLQFSLRAPKASVIQALTISNPYVQIFQHTQIYIHYLLFHNPVHVIPEPLPFFTIPLNGTIPHHHHEPELIHRILGPTHPKQIAAMQHTSLNRISMSFLAHSIWTSAMIPFTPNSLPVLSVKTSTNFPFLKTLPVSPSS